jgi:hypothetical protein
MYVKVFLVMKVSGGGAGLGKHTPHARGQRVVYERHVDVVSTRTSGIVAGRKGGSRRRDIGV